MDDVTLVEYILSLSSEAQASIYHGLDSRGLDGIAERDTLVHACGNREIADMVENLKRLNDLRHSFMVEYDARGEW